MGGSVVCYASVIDYPDGAFLLTCLPDARRALLVLRRTCWSLVVAWVVLVIEVLLSTVSCEVTGFSTEEACEDFPLSVLLNGSAWVSSFSAPSYPLFVSISSWAEVFCLRNSCTCSSWRCVHHVGISWCVVLPWFVNWWWMWSCFESVRSVFHVRIELLLLYRSVSPVLVVLGFWSPHDVGVHCIRESTGEDAQYQFLIEVISCMTYQLFKFCDECIEVSSF
jgi:hypothetical protein